jgi:hypothetical protein
MRNSKHILLTAGSYKYFNLKEDYFEFYCFKGFYSFIYCSLYALALMLYMPVILFFNATAILERKGGIRAAVLKQYLQKACSITK